MPSSANSHTEISDALLQRASSLSCASLHEAAGRIGDLPYWIKPLDPDTPVIGRAFPVCCPPGDNLPLHHAIYAASPGDVLVVETGAGTGFGYWGDIMTTAAMMRKIAGLVITGGVRDSRQLVAMHFPVFAGATSIRGTVKNPAAPSSVGAPITIGGVRIERGDLVRGDGDGVVILPKAKAAEYIAKAEERDVSEDQITERLKGGATTLEIYRLPALADGRPAPRFDARASVDVHGLSHGNLPIPAASRARGVIATGGVRGVNPETGVMPADVAEQAQRMFANLKTIVEHAGATVADILKVTIWIATPDARAAINGPWQELFPDAATRPARHILNYQLPGGMLVQCEALAIIGDRSH